MSTEVIHVRNAKPGDVYIGRAANLVPSGVTKMTAFGNPYRLDRLGANRGQVIDDYRRHLMRRPDLLRQMPALRGKRLACHCAPSACHGDVLSAFLRDHTDEELLRLADEIEAVS